MPQRQMTQHQMFDKAHTQLAGLLNLFMEMRSAPEPLTVAEMETLVATRPLYAFMQPTIDRLKAEGKLA